MEDSRFWNSHCAIVRWLQLFNGACFPPTSTGRFISAQGLVWWHFKQNTVSEIKGVFITSLTMIKAWESQAGVARVMPTTLIYVTVERVFIRECC